LSDKDKNIVCVLAGILRIADGLDRTHCSVVKEVECDLDGENILVKCKTAGSATFEFEAAKKKADLLEKVLEKPIRLQKCD
jgi:exopolyphosphatase/guanosine-5'-triphosphate,3'-diphosphate pyrophosphatase